MNRLAYRWSTVAYAEKPHVVGSRVPRSYIFYIRGLLPGSSIDIGTDSCEEDGNKETKDQREVCHLAKTKSSRFCMSWRRPYILRYSNSGQENAEVMSPGRCRKPLPILHNEATRTLGKTYDLHHFFFRCTGASRNSNVHVEMFRRYSVQNARTSFTLWTLYHTDCVCGNKVMLRVSEVENKRSVDFSVEIFTRVLHTMYCTHTD